MRVSSWVATVLLLLSIVAMATNANTSAYFAPESSPQSGFLCSFTSTVSPSTIAAGTPSVTVSGTDTCNPTESSLWAALLPGNPKLVDYTSNPCDFIESTIMNGGNNNEGYVGYLWNYMNGTGLWKQEFLNCNSSSCWNPRFTNHPPFIDAFSVVQDFALTDSSGQFSGNYPTSSLTPGSYCILLQVPCPQNFVSYPPGGFTPACQGPIYENLNVVESSSPSSSSSSSTSSTPFCFTCYIFTSATSSSPTCSAFLCSFATISQPAVTNTLPPATMIYQTQTLPPPFFSTMPTGGAASQTTTQPAPDFTISTSTPSQTVLQGQMVSYSVNVAALNGFNSQVSLSVSGLPSGANVVFSDPAGTPDFASTLTVTLPGNVPAGSYTLTVTGSGGGLNHVANLVLAVTASSSVTQTTTSPTQTSNDLMSMIQQNQILILGAIVLLAAVIIAVALRGQRKPTQPTQVTQSATPGTLYCRKCGTQNSGGLDFCTKCGNKLG